MATGGLKGKARAAYFLSKGLEIVYYALIALFFYIVVVDVVLKLYQVGSTSIELLDSYVRSAEFTGTLVTLTGIVIVAYVIGKVQGMLERQYRELEERTTKLLLGYIKAYKKIDVKTLAAKLGVSPKELEEMIAELAHEGKFPGRIVGTTIVAEEEGQEALPPAPPPPAVPPVSIDMPRTQQAPTMGEEEGTQVIPDQAQVAPAGAQAKPPARGLVEELEGESVDRIVEVIEEKAREGLVPQETLNHVRDMYRAYKDGVISEESLREVLKEVLREIEEKGKKSPQ